VLFRSPAQAYPIADNANERGSRFGDAFWPASFATVLRAPRFGSGERDVVSVNAGQFRPGSGDTGTERLVDSIGFDVTYSTAADVTDPLITQVGAIQDPGASTAKVFVRATDDSGSIRRVALLWNDGHAQWGFLDNLTSQGGGLYVGMLTGLTGHAELGAEVMDSAGNVAQSWDKAFNFQAAPDSGAGPSVVVSNPLPSQVYTLNQQVTPTVNCSDDGGVASCTPTPLVNGKLDTRTVGDHQLIVQATDLSGNISQRTITYRVVFAFDGFKPPVDNEPALNSARAGRTVPLKWGLLDAAGTQVSTLGAITAIGSRPFTCPGSSGDPVGVEEPPGLAGLKYSGGFQFNWTTQASWVGSCRRIYVQLTDGTIHTAAFKFN